LDHQNNYVERLITISKAKSFNILATSLNVLHNYFNGPNKLFSDLYLAKFLNTSAKPFFPCTDNQLLSLDFSHINSKNIDYKQ